MNLVTELHRGLSHFHFQVIRLKGLPTPSPTRLDNVSLPPPLPRVRGRSYFRNLRTPRPPIPLAKDTQLLHVSRQPDHYRPSETIQMNEKNNQEMGQAMTFTDDLMTSRSMNQMPQGPIGIAHDMI